jgi:hypothetical protein
MHVLIPIIAIPVLIAWAAMQMKSKVASPWRDFSFIAVITMLMALYTAF